MDVKHAFSFSQFALCSIQRTEEYMENSAVEKPAPASSSIPMREEETCQGQAFRI